MKYSNLETSMYFTKLPLAFVVCNAVILDNFKQAINIVFCLNEDECLFGDVGID